LSPGDYFAQSEPTLENQTILLRKDVPHNATWNWESVFSSYQDWETELKSIQAELSQKLAYQGRLHEGPEVVAEALEARQEIARRVAKVAMFAMIFYQVDKTDQQAGAMPGQAQALYGQAMAAGAFIEPELIAIGQETVLSWVQIEPRLAIYAHYFNDLFRKQAHVRSSEVEELLGMLAEPIANLETTYGLLVDADFTFQPAETMDGQKATISQTNFMNVMSSPDRRLRQTTWDNYLDEYRAHRNTLASNLATSIKANVFYSRARHAGTWARRAEYPRPGVPRLIEIRRTATWRRYFIGARRWVENPALRHVGADQPETQGFF
jgi:oligoendopeptidase F